MTPEPSRGQDFKRQWVRSDGYNALMPGRTRTGSIGSSSHDLAFFSPPDPRNAAIGENPNDDWDGPNRMPQLQASQRSVARRQGWSGILHVPIPSGSRCPRTMLRLCPQLAELRTFATRRQVCSALLSNH